MAIKQLYPDIRPSLLLDFANSGMVDQRINFKRLSSGTYYDKTDLLRTAGFNEPRIDYDPVHPSATDKIKVIKNNVSK